MEMRDNLTGVFSRKFILEEIKKRCIKKENFTLLFLDLNKFKLVNDTYGHFAGDLVLKEFVSRVKKILRKNDIIGRYGGDEFLILLDGELNKNDIIKIAKKIINVSNQPYNINGRKIFFLSVSIGVAFCHKGQTDFNELIHYSDKAMYFAKRFLKEKIAFYNDVFLKQEGNFRSEFIEGFENDEIFIKIKPVFYKDNIFAFEIIPVWINIYFGEIEYVNFKSILKEFNFETKFDEYIIKKSLNILKKYNIKHTIFIKISDSFFKSSELVCFLNDLFTQKINFKNKIVFEVNETALIDNFNLKENLNKLDCFGIKLCIDRITSGILGLLNYKIDYIKFDSNFKNINPQKERLILESLKFFSRAADSKLIGCNIQNEKKLKFLKECEIEYFEGDYLSKAHFPEYFKVKNEI